MLSSLCTVPVSAFNLLTSTQFMNFWCDKAKEILKKILGTHVSRQDLFPKWLAAIWYFRERWGPLIASHGSRRNEILCAQVRDALWRWRCNHVDVLTTFFIRQQWATIFLEFTLCTKRVSLLQQLGDEITNVQRTCCLCEKCKHMFNYDSTSNDSSRSSQAKEP